MNPHPIPRDDAFDATLPFLRHGYLFIGSRCRRFRTDLFETRLMGRRVFCALGEDAAQAFYVPGRFTRKLAIPATAMRLLQDDGSVASLDGPAHAHRKRLFMSVMAPDSTQRLLDHFTREWHARIARWSAAGEIVLHDELRQILCRAACAWAGIPLPEDEAPRRTREFAAMIEGAGGYGPRVLRGLLLRHRTERWMRRLVERARDGAAPFPEGSPAHAVANHRDERGQLLPPTIAAVELINLVRPTVAVARFVMFTALGLHEHPHARPREGASDGELERFCQEVRRFYPFFPAVGGRALVDFHWRGHHFPVGAWFLLDLYGTDHDPRLWRDPNHFNPDRFLDRPPTEFDLIPQGGGDPHASHRCAGESLTLALMKQSLRLLLSLRYDVPPQDLALNLARLPAGPPSGFRIATVRV